MSVMTREISATISSYPELALGFSVEAGTRDAHQFAPPPDGEAVGPGGHGCRCAFARGSGGEWPPFKELDLERAVARPAAHNAGDPGP